MNAVANNIQIFLSHSSPDKPFVEQLADDLEKAGLESWLDIWEIGVGDSILAKIEEGIVESAWLAVVLSKKSVKSAWVQKELSMAFVRELEERRVVILPIVIDDCEIPLSLRDKLYADVRLGYEKAIELLIHRIKGTNPKVARQKRKLESYWLKCDQQLPFLCYFMAASLSAGIGIGLAFQKSAKELPEPLSSECENILRSLGPTPIVTDIFQNLFDRIPTERCKFLLSTMLMGQDLGVNLSSMIKDTNYLRDIAEGIYLR